jgi:hypothetical protein
MPLLQSLWNLYLRTLVLSGSCFGLIVGVYVALSSGLLMGLVTGLVMGAIFGLLLSSLLFLMQFATVRLMSYDVSEETLGVYQVRTLEMGLPYEEAFILCVASLQAVKGAKLQSEDRAEGRIEAKTGINWKTLGDDISIDILRSSHTMRIRVVSRPSLMTTVVDYGQNLDNVERMTGYLKAHGAVVHGH